MLTYFFLGLTVYILVTAVARILSEIYTLDSISFVQCIDGGVYILLQLMNLVSMAVFIIKQKEFLKSVQGIDKVDKLFGKYGVSVSCGLLQLILIILLITCPIYLFIIAVPMWDLINGLKKEQFYEYRPRNNILQFANLAPLFVVRHTPVYFYSGFMAIVHNRFSKLNNYLMVMEHTKGNEKECIDNALTLVEKMHNLLFLITQQISDTFSLPIFFNISLTFLELIAAIVILEYSIDVQSFQIISGVSLFILTALFILTICYKTKNVVSYF